jgi:hypothetical protein
VVVTEVEGVVAVAAQAEEDVVEAVVEAEEVAIVVGEAVADGVSRWCERRTDLKGSYAYAQCEGEQNGGGLRVSEWKSSGIGHRPRKHYHDSCATASQLDQLYGRRWRSMRGVWQIRAWCRAALERRMIPF